VLIEAWRAIRGSESSFFPHAEPARRSEAAAAINTISILQGAEACAASQMGNDDTPTGDKEAPEAFAQAIVDFEGERPL
jgi:hypothetical protein